MPDGSNIRVRGLSANRLHAKRNGSEARRASAARERPPDWLSLPRIGKVAGKPIAAARADAKIARLAHSMLKAGLLMKDSPRKTIAELVAHGMEQWLRSIWWAQGKPRLFKLSAHLTGSVFDDEWIAQSMEAVASWPRGGRSSIQQAFTDAFELQPDREHVALVIQAQERTDLYVHRGVKRLESACAGLGFEALRAVEEKGGSFGLLGGQWFLWAASRMYWAGGESEQDWVNEWGESLEEYSGITRARFNELVPNEWIEGKPMSERQLTDIAKRATGNARVAAEAILSLRRSGQEGFSFGSFQEHMEWAELLSPSVMLWWDGATDLDRIADDYANEVYQGESPEPPGIGIVLVPTDDPEWFARKSMQWEGKARTLALLEQLLGLIGERAR